MRCPSCDKQVNDLDAAFCPRCGAALGAPQGDATKEISEPAESRSPRLSNGATEVVPVGDGTTGAGEIDQPGPPIVREFFRALRGSLRQQGATDIVAAAAFAFLVLVACGAVLVAAAKLQYQFLGEGSGSFSVLSAIVMVGLGALRVPIHIGELGVGHD